MVGLIPKVLMNWLYETGGDGLVAEVLQAAQAPPDQKFRMNEVYDDALCLALFDATCRVRKLEKEQLYDGYAKAFMDDVMTRFPKWREMAPSARSFLERQPVIHNGFATAVQDPAARAQIEDKFRIQKLENAIITHYVSPNRLCGLYKALARWVLSHYGEKAEIKETRCLLSGDPECEIHVTWQEA